MDAKAESQVGAVQMRLVWIASLPDQTSITGPVITVEFHTWNGPESPVIGTVTWDGKRLSAKGEGEFERVLLDPIWLRGGETVDPAREPEKFIRNLWLHYKSPYFMASKPVVTEDLSTSAFRQGDE